MTDTALLLLIPSDDWTGLWIVLSSIGFFCGVKLGKLIEERDWLAKVAAGEYIKKSEAAK